MRAILAIAQQKPSPGAVAESAPASSSAAGGLASSLRASFAAPTTSRSSSVAASTPPGGPYAADPQRPCVRAPSAGSAGPAAHGGGGGGAGLRGCFRGLVFRLDAGRPDAEAAAVREMVRAGGGELTRTAAQGVVVVIYRYPEAQAQSDLESVHACLLAEEVVLTAGCLREMAAAAAAGRPLPPQWLVERHIVRSLCLRDACVALVDSDDDAESVKQSSEAE